MFDIVNDLPNRFWISIDPIEVEVLPNGGWVGKRKRVRAWIDEICQHPQHLPAPMLLYIPPGGSVVYKCPACGNVTTLHGSRITY